MPQIQKETNKLKTHRAGDMYRWFKKNNPDTDITYPLFKETISQFNKLATEHILDGHTLKLGSYMGAIRVKKYTRMFAKKPRYGPAGPGFRYVDWAATKKLLEDTGIRKLVVFTDDYYFGWYWDRGLCKVKNKTVYVFKPTTGAKGNRKRLSRFLKSDEMVKTLYKE